MVQPLQAHNDGKYDSNGEVDFPFDDGNKMSYKNILSITWSWMGQFNTYNPTFCEKKGRQLYILYHKLCTNEAFLLSGILFDAFTFLSITTHLLFIERADWSK